MFEQTLAEMTAAIHIEQGMFGILNQSNVGLGTCGIYNGTHIYTFDEALEIIKKIDKSLVNCPKYLYKRIRATRMQFMFAFGPDMEEAL